MKFILKFGSKTMVVFDALLSEKKILMAGSLDYSISNIIEFVFAAASLISPPLFGVQTKVYPYAQLSQITRLMQEKSYVAGVTNPMFIQNKACYDLLCQVDVGKLLVPKNADLPYEKEAYYKVDQDFINSLIFRIRQNSINDADLRMAFSSYTRLMLDIAVGNLTTLKHNGRDMA